MKSRIILFIVVFLVWLGLTWSIEPSRLIIGAFVGLIVAVLIGDMFVERPHILGHPSRYLWFAYYVPFFLWECFKANIDVAFRVIHPGLPISPGIVEVTTSLKSDTALTFLANSITLTPGTLSVDVDRDRGLLYVHWIDVKSQDREEATKKIVERFEKILKRIFD